MTDATEDMRQALEREYQDMDARPASRAETRRKGLKAAPAAGPALTPRENHWLDLVAGGMSRAEAYREAYQRPAGGTEAINRAVGNLARKAAVRERLQALETVQQEARQRLEKMDDAGLRGMAVWTLVSVMRGPSTDAARVQAAVAAGRIRGVDLFSAPADTDMKRREDMASLKAELLSKIRRIAGATDIAETPNAGDKAETRQDYAVPVMVPPDWQPPDA